jgi:hypothetical protein
MKQEFEKIQVYKVDVEDALSSLSAIETLAAPAINSTLEFRLHRLRSCLEHMLEK